MSDLFDLYVEAGSPNGDADLDKVIAWAEEELSGRSKPAVPTTPPKRIERFDAAQLSVFLASVPPATKVIIGGSVSEADSRANSAYLAKGSYDGRAGAFSEGRGTELFVIIRP